MALEPASPPDTEDMPIGPRGDQGRSRWPGSESGEDQDVAGGPMMRYSDGSLSSEADKAGLQLFGGSVSSADRNQELQAPNGLENGVGDSGEGIEGDLGRKNSQ